MTRQKVRHILGLSGGKDSAALAVYMREKYPEIPLEYVFIDSGCELPETYEYLNKIRALLNINIIAIHSPRDFNYWLKYFGGVLPSPTNRWCTRLLKLQPYNDWLRKNCVEQQVYSYVGLRADEDREGYRSSTSELVPVHPFIDAGLVLDDIIQILNGSGIGLPSYYTWRQRSGCYFCFYQREDEWRGLRLYHPDLFEKACRYEEQHSDGRDYTWRSSGRLRELTQMMGKGTTEVTRKRPLLLDSLSKIDVKSVTSSKFLLGGKR
jgi:3'-phosphoadenosine 5'-phosphosulfate sulfotransferase (PAPS reductase)/FAD synthetase